MSQKKSKLSRILNIILLFFVGYALLNLYRQYRSGESAAGRIVADLPLTPVDGGEIVKVSSTSGPKVIIAWATWCGPCTVELSRVNNLVKDGQVDPNQVFAISVGEDRATVAAAAKERDYVFPVYWDEESKSGNWLPIAGTPTIAYVRADNTIADVDTGINPLFGFKLTSFLNANAIWDFIPWNKG